MSTAPTKLAQHIHTLHYRSYIIEEACSAHPICRNILCVPREQTAAFERTPAIQNALAWRWLTPVMNATGLVSHLNATKRLGYGCSMRTT